MLFPKNLLYTRRHVWAKVDETKQRATVGITDSLQENLPEILSIDMPLVGDELEMDADCVHLHLPGRIQGLPSPLTGRVLAINRDVLDAPQLLHLSPYESWLFLMEYDEPDEVEMLMNPNQYANHVDSL
jgi:glycine cleavage system H protein